MEELQKEMHLCFPDVNKRISKDAWVMDPFLPKEEDVEYLQSEDELMDIKFNSLHKLFYAEHGYKWFWLVNGPGVALRLAHHVTTRFIMPFATRGLSDSVQLLVTSQTKAHTRLDVHSDIGLVKSHQASHHWLRKYSLRALIKNRAAWTVCNTEKDDDQALAAHVGWAVALLEGVHSWTGCLNW